MTRSQALAVRPAPDEYAPYYDRYIARVPDGSILDTLAAQIEATRAALAGVTEGQAEFRYAPGKWSVKEVLGHMADSERVFSYRALRFARGDATPLPGFDENLFVPNGQFGRRDLEDIVSEFTDVRRATLSFFGGLGEEAIQRRGVANDVEISVRATAWIIAGHELHHRGVLLERYLAAAAPRG